jgi:CRP/FNR family transcriptional regulator, cyclic AMP receptor protein
MVRTAEFFAGLPDHEIDALESLGTPVVLAEGEVLFQIGDDATQLYLVRDGVIDLAMPMQVEGHTEDVRVEQCQAGQALGWSTLVPPHRFTLKASASGHALLIALPRGVLLAHLAERPEVGYALMRNVTAMLGQRLQIFQAMWLRQMQQLVDLTHG